jgi:hypothetical protein
MKVRLKPAIVQAHRWFLYAPHPLVRPLPVGAWGEKLCTSCNYAMREHGYAVGLRGTLRCCPGSWVIEGKDVTVIKDWAFREEYDEVVEDGT